MKVYIKTTEVSTNKDLYHNELIILCLTDLHYTKNFNPQILPFLLDKVKEIKPDYICFLGDLVDDDSYDVVIDWLKKLAHVAPVYFVYGNHDLEHYRIENYKYRVKSTLPGEIKKEISNIYNLRVLKNNKVDYQGPLCFCGTNFYHATQFDNFIKYLNRNTPSLDDDHFNILLSHNPGIMKPEVFSKLNNNYQGVNLILSGHTHNGLIPPKIDKAISGTTGLFLGTDGVFPKYTRNNVKIENNKENTTGVIVPPIRTLPDRGNLFNVVNDKFYDPGMQLIRIKNGNY